MLQLIEENLKLITLFISMFALFLSLWNFVKQHFSVAVIMYPRKRDDFLYLVLENVGSSPAKINGVKMKVIQHNEPIFKSGLPDTPFFKGEIPLDLPSKMPYEFLIGTATEKIAPQTVFPIIQIEVSYTILFFFKMRKTKICDYNIYKTYITISKKET